MNTQLEMHLHKDRQSDRKICISIDQWESDENQEKNSMFCLSILGRNESKCVENDTTIHNKRLRGCMRLKHRG